MPYFEVTYESTGFTDSRAASDTYLSARKIRKLMEEAEQENIRPDFLMAVLEGYSTPDDGQDKTDIKVFTPIRVLVRADSEEDAEDLDPPEKLLNKAVELLSPQIASERNWYVANVDAGEMAYPDRSWIVNQLRNNWHSKVSYPVLSAFVIGSEAKGTAHENSDIDIAVIIPSSTRISALKRSERYHSKFVNDNQKPKWAGRIVDFQFFYEGDSALAGYAKIPLFFTEERKSA